MLDVIADKATECLSEDGKKVSRVVPKGATANMLYWNYW